MNSETIQNVLGHEGEEALTALRAQYAECTPDQQAFLRRAVLDVTASAVEEAITENVSAEHNVDEDDLDAEIRVIKRQFERGHDPYDLLEVSMASLVREDVERTGKPDATAWIISDWAEVLALYCRDVFVRVDREAVHGRMRAVDEGYYEAVDVRDEHVNEEVLDPIRRLFPEWRDRINSFMSEFEIVWEQEVPQEHAEIHRPRQTMR